MDALQRNKEGRIGLRQKWYFPTAVQVPTPSFWENKQVGKVPKEHNEPPATVPTNKIKPSVNFAHQRHRRPSEVSFLLCCRDRASSIWKINKGFEYTSESDDYNNIIIAIREVNVVTHAYYLKYIFESQTIIQREI